MNELVPQPSPSTELVVPWEAPRDDVTYSIKDLRPIEKAAVIVAAIGPEVAGDLLKELSEQALARCATAIAGMHRVPLDLLDAVIAEFVLSIGTDEEVSGGIQTARRLLAEVLDESTIEKIMFDIEGGMTEGAWKKLNDCSVAALSAFIGAEHPQTAAVVMSELRADKAAGVVERLDPEFAQQTVLRLAHVSALDSTVADMVERVIARDFLSVLQKTKRARKPADMIAGLMNNLSSETREKFLTHLEETKPALAKEVQRVMFTFADIRKRVEARDIGLLTKDVDEQELLIALKSAQVTRIASADFILENMSRRLSERLVEEIEAMPDVSPKDGEAAQQSVVRVIQDMAKAGKITLVQEDGPEE